MASISLSFSDELFVCHICLEMFSDPVTTPCGHNFCEDCIKRCWESGQLVLCPICKTRFENEPELKIKKVVDHFKVHQMAKKLQHPAKATFQQPLCDICLENTRKAVKSCLHCEISFCETHLESHKTAPRLMKHKLIDPVENVDDHICRKHDKPLEIFCRDDQTCLCLLCSETEHKTHKAVPIDGNGCRRIQLGKSQEEIMVMIHERQRKIKDIKNIAKPNKSTIERNKADKMELFRDLVRSIERCQSELLEVMEQKQKAAEKQAEDLIEELEKEITELRKRNTQLLHTEDHLHLLQVHSSVCSRSLVKTSTNINTDTDLQNSETIEKSLACLKENINKQLKKIHEISQLNVIQKFHFLPTTQSAANRIFVFGGTTDSVPSHPLVPKVSSVMEKKDASDTTRAKQGMLKETVTIKTNKVQTQGKIYFTVGRTDKVFPSRNRPKHKEGEVSRFGMGISPLADLCTIKKLFAVDVTLDANTAYPKLTLSRNGKQVRYGGFWTDVPNNPERFDSSACVLAKDGFSCGKFYYEVKVSDKIEWDLGMAKKSIKRKGKIRVSPENGFWCLWLRNRSEYVANESSPVSLALKVKPQTVGVFVDYEEGLVSFYNVETKSLIYSFTGQSFNEKIYPFFSPCNKSGNENLKPLIISNLSQFTM